MVKALKRIGILALLLLAALLVSISAYFLAGAGVDEGENVTAAGPEELPQIPASYISSTP